MDIKQTAELIQAGDEAAFKAFYEAYFGRIFSFLMTILRNAEDAEDVTSVAFIYVWDNRSKLRNPEQLVSWLYQIAKHRAFDYLRKHKNEASSSIEDIEETMADSRQAADQTADQYFSNQMVQGLLANLSSEEKSIIHLRFSEDLDFNAIAERLDMTSVAVRVRLHRAIKKLQKQTDGDVNQNRSFWHETIL